MIVYLIVTYEGFIFRPTQCYPKKTDVFVNVFSRGFWHIGETSPSFNLGG